MKFISLLTVLATFLPGQTPTATDELNRGISVYEEGKYADAVTHFKRALELDPANLTVHLYLGTAYSIQVVPGLDSPANKENHDLATEQFKWVLGQEPSNALALAMLASMAYNQAAAGTPEERAAALDEAQSWNARRVEVNPQDPEAYYYLGVIAWSRVYQPIQAQRALLGMQPTDPGPIRDSARRRDLQRQFYATIVDGITNLNKCLALDLQNEDAMSYMNLILRKKADLDDSAEAARTDIAAANDWADKAIATKEAKIKVTTEITVLFTLTDN